MIELKNISKSFGSQKVIDDLTVSFEENAINCLLSPSGSGKTTLLRILSGLEKADSGTLSEVGKVSFVFQEDRLLPWLNALQNIAIVSNETKAKEYLELMKLSEFAEKTPPELSGGMNRRIAVARALSYDSDVLILDEPFKGMDNALKESVYPLIWQQSKSRTVILTTHNLEEAAYLADCVFCFSENGLKLKKEVHFETEQNLRNEKIINEYVSKIRADCQN